MTSQHYTQIKARWQYSQLSDNVEDQLQSNQMHWACRWWRFRNMFRTKSFGEHRPRGNRDPNQQIVFSCQWEIEAVDRLIWSDKIYKAIVQAKKTWKKKRRYKAASWGRSGVNLLAFVLERSTSLEQDPLAIEKRDITILICQEKLIFHPKLGKPIEIKQNPMCNKRYEQ